MSTVQGEGQSRTTRAPFSCAGRGISPFYDVDIECLFCSFLQAPAPPAIHNTRNSWLLAPRLAKTICDTVALGWGWAGADLWLKRSVKYSARCVTRIGENYSLRLRSSPPNSFSLVVIFLHRLWCRRPCCTLSYEPIFFLICYPIFVIFVRS